MVRTLLYTIRGERLLKLLRIWHAVKLTQCAVHSGARVMFQQTMVGSLVDIRFAPRYVVYTTLLKEFF